MFGAIQSNVLENPSLWIGRASYRLEEAANAIRHSLALNPDDVLCNSTAACCYYQLQRYPEARKSFEKVLELDPASATFPMIYLGSIALLESRDEDAESYARMFVKLHPNYPKAPSYLRALREMGKKHVQNETVLALHKPLQ